MREFFRHIFPSASETDLTMYELWVQFYEDPSHRQLVLDSMVRLTDPGAASTYYAADLVPPPLDKYSQTDLRVLLRGGEPKETVIEEVKPTVPLSALIHAGLLPAAALPLDDTTDASGITLAEFMRHFA